MPVIAPFKALRYSARLAPHLAKLVAPQSTSPTQLDALHAAHANNVAHLAWPREAGAEPFSAAARAVGEWLEKGVLVEDDRPALYVYAQRFTRAGGEEQTREGVFAAVRLDQLPALERTGAAVAARRSEHEALLSATQVNISPPVALYEDAERSLDARLAQVRGEPIARLRTSDEVQHALWRVTDPSALAFATERLAHTNLVLADGHERTEAALRHRDAMRAKYPDAGPDASFEFISMFLCASAHPALNIVPTHRVLAAGEALNPDKLIAGLSKHFFITQRLTPPATSHGARLLMRELASASEKGPSFAVSVPKMPTTLVCILKPGTDLGALPGMPSAEALRALDVTALHALCLEPLLGIGADTRGRLDFEEDTTAALQHIAAGRNPAVFFLPPARVEQVLATAQAGVRMPPRTLSLHPQLATGLVMRRVDPSARLQRP